MNSRRNSILSLSISILTFSLAACETQQDFGATEDYFRNAANTNANGSILVSGGGESSNGGGTVDTGGNPGSSTGGTTGGTIDNNGTPVDINPCAANINPLLNLSDSTIFDLALAKRLGKCYISDSRNISTHYCDYYVKSAAIGSLGYNGYPKNPYSGDSTGCVVAPSLPKHVSTCWDGYTPGTMCTNDYVKNAANQIRQAIIDGACGCSNF